MAVPKALRIALVYDRAAAQGGAERVLVGLHEAFPNAPLYTSLLNRSEAPWSAGWSIRTSWLQRLPSGLRKYRWWGWVMPFVFEGFDFSAYDVVISVTGEAAKSIITQPHQLHICYLLTPTRYLWSNREGAEASIWKPLQPLAKKVLRALAKWDKATSARPDVIIPISQLVSQRSQEFYGRKTRSPIYPPLTLLPTPQAPVTLPEEPYLFSWGRHVAYKRFELVIEAAVKEKTRLILAGQGPQTKQLRSLAKKLDSQQKFVRFLGRISDAELHWYLQHAAGAIFPQIEDFGIVAGEAVLAGCPVLVHEKSGVTEILTRDQSVTIDSETVAQVRSGMKQLLAKTWPRLDMQHQARQYAGERFVKQWPLLVEKLWLEHQTKLLKLDERDK
jgi:glycosyltransferase involved in cell wall biosynthesis